MTRSTTPAPLGETELEFATFHEGYVSRYIQLADAKAGTALVVTAGTLGYFLGQDAFVAALRLQGPSILRPLAYASGALLALSAIMAFATIAPRGSKAGTGLVYWNDVAARTKERFIEDVRGAGSRLRPPYVLKADWIAHKTEHAAVRVGLRDLDSLLAAYDEMAGRLGPGTYVVEEQDVRPDVVELIVGARRDPVFGPLLLVGAGGSVAELVRDTAVDLAPVSRRTAHALVARLGVHPLLTGWRGRPPVDLEALEHLLVALSEQLAAAPDEVLEVELNPVRVGPDGVLAVDALVVTSG